MRSTTQTLQHNKREKSRSAHVTHFQHFKKQSISREKKRGGCLEQRTTTTQTRKGERREKKAEKQITRVLQLISTHTHIHTHTNKAIGIIGTKNKGHDDGFRKKPAEKKKLSTHRVSEGRKKKTGQLHYSLLL